MTDQTVKLLTDLVSFKTVSGDHLQADDLYNFVLNKVKGFGLKTAQVENQGYKSLILATKRLKSPKVLLLAHIDVVPAPDDMFQLKTYKGKLYGRGVSDMKFAVAVYLTLLDRWFKQGS